jgi:hypothetical protein
MFGTVWDRFIDLYLTLHAIHTGDTILSYLAILGQSIRAINQLFLCSRSQLTPPPPPQRSIPFSQFLRLDRICIEDDDVQAKYLEIRNFFVQRLNVAIYTVSGFSITRHCLFEGLQNSPI